MSNRSKLSTLIAALFFALPSLASAITIDLTAASSFPTQYQGRQVIAVGKDGLFLDHNAAAPAAWQGNPSMQTAFANWSDPSKNFTWLDVTLDINDTTGNASVTGTMSNNAVAGDLYDFSMNLSGMCFRNGATCQARDALPGLDLRAFLEDPANARNDALGLNLDTGLEWADVSVNISAQPGGPAQAYNGVSDLVGWAMPPEHVNPVELYIWSNSPGAGDLYFAAWYQAFNAAGQRIATADTKAFGKLLDDPVTPPPVTPPTEIPEPATAILLGAAGLAGALRRKKQA